MPPVVGRIRRQATFRALSRPEGRGQMGTVAVAFSSHVPEVKSAPLVGYSIGRRHGGAVERNRLRRRLRAAVRAFGPELPAGAYLVRAAPGAGELPFEELRRAVRAAARAAAAGADGEGRRIL